MMNEKKKTPYFPGTALCLIKICALFIYLYHSRLFMQVWKIHLLSVSPDTSAPSKQMWTLNKQT